MLVFGTIQYQGWLVTQCGCGGGIANMDEQAGLELNQVDIFLGFDPGGAETAIQSRDLVGAYLQPTIPE